MNSSKAGKLPGNKTAPHVVLRSEEHTSELQSHEHLVCRLLLEKKGGLGLGRQHDSVMVHTRGRWKRVASCWACRKFGTTPVPPCRLSSCSRHPLLFFLKDGRPTRSYPFPFRTPFRN